MQMNMEFRMELLMLIVCVTPAIVRSITISSNGNSPKIKMIGGMMADLQKGFVPMTPKLEEATIARSNYEKSRKINFNSTKLALNERYRRLIPYMTFYYANDFATPATDSTRNVEVEKAQIVEAQNLANERQPKKIIYSQRNIPRYQGNRLTQYNIASANPTKVFYKNGVPVYQTSKLTSNFNPLLSSLPVYDYESGRIVQSLAAKPPGAGFTSVKRPFLNLYNEESPNIRYYLSEKEQSPKYKLVPYEQTPPVKVPYVQAPVKRPYEHSPIKIPYQQGTPSKTSYEQIPLNIRYEQATPLKISNEPVSPLKVAYEQTPVKMAYEQAPVKVSYEQAPIKPSYEQILAKPTYETPIEEATYNQKEPQSEDIYEPRKPVIVSVLVPKELYVKPRPVRPSFLYGNDNSQSVRKHPAIISETYYEKQRPQIVAAEPVIQSGFKPIVRISEYSTEAPIHTSTLSETPIVSDFVEPSPITPVTGTRPNYYQYNVDNPKPTPSKQSSVTLATLLNSLQVNKSIPKPITRQNVASSIRTLLQVLNTLKAVQTPNDVEPPVLSTPKPFLASKVVKVVNEPQQVSTLSPDLSDPDLHEEPYLTELPTPSQHLDDNHSFLGGTSQQFPLPVTSDEEGGTPGRPGVDYPVLTTIPQTSFSCKTQRYKGFFADTETRCQVWHYCDLNGGQASFLCPNGTIFSQAGLTCDWWFNVRCDSTAQLYVLNESLYKYILPHSPKFPEDYSGPLVDKYLTLKFKEMEEEFKKNKSSKNDKSESEEDDDDDDDDDDEDPNTDASTSKTQSSAEMDKRQLSELSEASVIVESPGNSGKVERLQDD